MARTGAKRATLREFNPRELVSQLMSKHPTLGTEELFALFRKALAGNFSNYQESVDRYCFDNQFRAINEEPPPARRKTKTKLKIVAKLSQTEIAGDKAAGVKAAEARLIELGPIILMKLPTPHGPLGELTGAQGRKLTGWMAHAFDGVRDTQKLRDAKSEEELRTLWQRD